jgi:hypothetical protein
MSTTPGVSPAEGDPPAGVVHALLIEEAEFGVARIRSSTGESFCLSATSPRLAAKLVGIFARVVSNSVDNDTQRKTGGEEVEHAQRIGSVETIAGETYHLGPLEMSTTAIQLKRMVSEKTDLPVGSQRLYLVDDIRPEGEADLELHRDNATVEELCKFVLSKTELKLSVLIGRYFECVHTFSYVAATGQASNVLWSNDGGIAMGGELQQHKLALVDDGSAVQVEEAGIYRVDLQLLNTSGHNIYPNISVNGTAKLYGYGGGQGYCAANMNVALKLEAGDKVSINLSNNGGGSMPLADARKIYHSLTVQRLAELDTETCIHTFSYVAAIGQTGNVLWSNDGGIAMGGELQQHKLALVDDGSAVQVEEAGIYRVDLQLLNTSGHNIYPNISVNGTAKLYGYGGGQGYCAANMNVALKLEAGDKVSINLSNNGTGSMPLADVRKIYHSLTVQRVC